MRRLIWLVALLLGVLPACSAPPDTRDLSTPVAGSEAVEFGAVTLPAGVEVLGADTDSGQDTRYRLALRMTVDQLAEFLPQFAETPEPSQIPESTTVLAGPDLSDAPAPRFAQDRIDTGPRTVVRDVIVDERSPDEVYVHLSLFTT